jgi:hypothetical protein
MTTRQLLLPIIPFAGWAILTLLFVATTLLAPVWISAG